MTNFKFDLAVQARDRNDANCNTNRTVENEILLPPSIPTDMACDSPSPGAPFNKNRTVEIEIFPPFPPPLPIDMASGASSPSAPFNKLVSGSHSLQLTVILC